ncbi:hypothetical protein HDR61_00465 [bacterium]|nr:hypothetical protein [bacterium]
MKTPEFLRTLMSSCEYMDTNSNVCAKNADMIYEKYDWADPRNIKPDGFIAVCNIDGVQYEVKLTTCYGMYCRGAGNHPILTVKWFKDLRINPIKDLQDM